MFPWIGFFFFFTESLIVEQDQPAHMQIYLALLSCLISYQFLSFKSFPNDKILGLTKLKTFADNKFNVANMISFFDSLENMVGKGENAGYQHFLLFLQCFQNLYIRVIKNQDCVVKS